MSAIQSPGLTAEDVTAELESRRAARASEFLTLCRRIAGGERPRVAEIELAIAHAGKTPADLRVAVEAIERRQRWAANLQAADGIDGEEQILRQQAMEADARFGEAQRAHAQTADGLRAQLAAIAGKRRRATDARRELVKGCIDPVLVARHHAVTDALDRDEHRRRTRPLHGPEPEGLLSESELDDLRAELASIEEAMMEP